MKKTTLMLIASTGLLVSCGDNGFTNDPDGPNRPDNPATTLHDEGIYLSIYAFNNGITDHKNFTRITDNSVEVLKQWIDPLATSNGTALYYADDKAMDYIESVKFPEDLNNVYLVTWTDGIDQASAAQNDSKYDSPEAYRSAVKNRITTEKFHGFPLNAYGIGVNVDNQSDFGTVVRDLSSSEANARVLDDMSSVNETFANIAKGLREVNTSSDIMFTDISNNADEICFTFDGLPRETSRYKIEAKFTDNKTMTLSDVVYTGITSSSGNTVRGSNVNGALSDYTFKDIKRSDDGNLSNPRLYRSSLSWNLDVEFDPTENTTEIITQKTVAVVLVLDMSNSLGDDVSEVKRAAQSFIEALAEEPVDTSGVVIGGTTWATRNVGTTGRFALYPESSGGFFTPDEAQTACPTGWRLPTLTEFQRLDLGVWRIREGIYGRIFGNGNNTIFLPAADAWLSSGAPCGIYYSSNSFYVFTLDAYGISSLPSPITPKATVRCVRQ